MAILQLSLTFGAPLGEYVLGGQNKVLPPRMRFVSSTFCILFVCIGLMYLQRGNVIDLGFSPLLVNIVITINTVFLAYAIISNAIITKSKKERYLMTPISVVQFVNSIIVLLIE